MSTSRMAGDAAAQLPSPLAQIYQPIAVDDDIPEDAEADAQLASGTAALSFGPVTRRRRLSSRVHARVPADVRSGLGLNVRKPSLGSSPMLRNRPLPDDVPLASPSPDKMPWPESAGQVEEEEGERGGDALPWVKRLDMIEERQKRIEDLLIQLTRRSH
jgi:hypothetical protein